jgi:competence protein ComEC
MPLLSDACVVGRIKAGVIAPPDEFFSETNDNSVAILLSYGTARVLLARDAEAREEEYMAGGPYTGPLTDYKKVRAKIPRPADQGQR